MAVETLDEVYTGDPKPPPKLADEHRARLDSIVQQMVKNKESDSSIQMVVNDFKQKYTKQETTPPQPSFNVQISEPAFKSAPSQTQLKEFSFDKPYDVLAVEKLQGKATQAHAKLQEELAGNRPIKEKMIRQRRFEESTRDIPLPVSDMPKTQSQIDAARLMPVEAKPHELPVTDEDIKNEDVAIQSDRGKAVRLLEETMKAMPEKEKDIQKNVYLLDAYNSLANTPEIANERAAKIESNAKRIGKDLIYDARTNTLIKPTGLLGSAVEGWKQKSKLFADYDFFKNTDNDAAIASELEDRRTNHDPDEPIAIPRGKLAEVVSMIGGSPIKPMVGGLVTSALTTPLGGAVAGGAIGGREFSKLEYATNFNQVYNELRNQGVDKFEAVRKARSQAENAAEVGAIMGAAMGVVGVRMGMRPMGLSTAFKQSAFNILKTTAKELGKAGAEGLAVGGIGGAGQLYKNKLAQSIGVKRDLSEGVLEQIEGGLLTTVALAAIIKAGRGIPKMDYRNILHGIAKLPDEQISGMLQEKANAGEITQKAADEAIQRINEYREKDAQIPANVTEEARFKIQDNIDKLNELEQQKEATHKSLQEPIKEKIQKLTEDNLALSKEVDKIEKPETGLTKKQEKEAAEFAEELIAEGIIPGTYEAGVKSDPIGFWKEIAQQAQNRDASWRPLKPEDAGASEQSARDQFGDTVVDYAKELFPAPELEVPKAVSVIQPGEISRPETITIKPREEATDKPTENKNTILGEPIITKVEDGDLYEYRTPDGLVAGVRTSPTEFRIDGISATEVGKGKGSKLFEALISDLNEQGVTTIRTESAGEGAIKMHQKAIDKGLITEIEREGSHAIFEINKPKTKENAIPIRSSEEVIVDEAPRDSQEVVGGIPESGEVAIPQEGQSQEGSISGEEKVNNGPDWVFGEKEGEIPNKEGQVGEPSMTGITHRQMDILAEELGLPTYEKSPERVSEWDQQAAKKLQQPESLDNLFTKLRNGELPDHVETRMMLQYMGDIMAKIERDPYNRALQDQLLRTKDLFNIAGRLQGKGLAARKGQIPVEETLPDFIIRDREVNKAPLTDEQITKSKEEFEEIKKAKDDYEQKVAKLEAENARLKAEKIIKEQAKKTTKQTKDYSSERKQIVSDIRTKLRKARGETSIVAVPYAKELIAIAPDVVKLAKTYIDQGVAELPELVKSIKDALAEDMPHLTEVDVHNIIAGEYNEKKPTRSQLAQQLYDLRREAKLINELDDLQNGKIPVAKDKQLQRNRKIEGLKGQIKELRDELGITNVNKLSALKSRYKKQIADVENKIASKDYGPDVKPEPLKLDEEAIELKDKMIKAKAEREARLAQMEYEQMSGGKKALDLANQSLDAVRTIQTNPDLSFFGRQGIKYFMTHPIQGPKLFWESVKQAFSQSRYDRWLYDIHNSKAWKLIEESELAVLDPNTLHTAQREEQWRSQLIHKIPGAGLVAKASERAFTSAANMARVDWFMEGVSILEKQGKTWENSANEYKAWASAVNNMTGRGGLGKFEPVVGQLAIPFWSPRLIASNVNLFLNPVYYAKMPKTSRLMLIKNMAQYVGTGLAFLGLAKTLGADVELDPRSSDFGKIKVGNTRYDVWGGASQYIRVLTQIFKGQRKTGNEISELNTRSKVMTGANLIRTKLSPIIGFGVDAFLGENVVGEKVEWKDAYRLLIPMLYNDIKDAAKDEKGGPETAAIAGLLSFLGIGAQTYGGKKDSGASTTRSVNRSQTRTKSKKIKRI